MQKIWIKMLATGCAISLFMTTSGMMVMAEELQEDVVVTSAENLEETIEYERTLDEEELIVEDEITEQGIDEDIVGVGNVTVGNNVTATFDSSTGAIKFYSNGGTLWSDWIEKGGFDRNDIKSIKVESGIVFLPADSSGYLNNKFRMFGGLRNLTDLDLRGFDSTNVTNMQAMFYQCFSLTNLDLSSFDTSNVTNMQEMFSYCISLTNLDLSNFDTSNVTTMKSMFDECRSFTNLDLSSLDTSNVTDMSAMFGGCRGLTDLNLKTFDTSNVTDMDSMFTVCESLITLDLSSFDTSNVTNMSAMFEGCRGLMNLNLRNFDTSNVIKMSDMFNYSGIKYLNLSSFNTSNVKDMGYMFYGCINLTDLDLNGFDTSSVTDMGGMFRECSGLTNLDLSSFNTSNVTDMGEMFLGCNLTSLDLSGFDTLNVTDMRSMFNNCKNLKNLDLSSFITNNVTNMGYMFYNCKNLSDLDLSRFDTSKAIEICAMFENCSELTNLDLSNFTTSNVQLSYDIFTGCDSLKRLVTPRNNTLTGKQLPSTMYDGSGNKYDELPILSKSIVLIKRTELSNCTVTISPTSFKYDGKVKQPVVTVKDGGSTLVNGTDYSVTYSNNTNAGNGNVTVTGRGYYIGQVNKAFTIEKAASTLKFTSSNVIKKITDAPFTNTLTKTTDGTITFKSSNTSVASIDNTGKVTIRGAGTTTITVVAAEGTNYQSGSASYTLTVEKGDISNCTVSISPTSYTYDGNAKKPSVTVKNGETTLTLNAHYSVEYSNNTNAGKATVKVTGINNYTGAKSVQFTINKATPVLKFTNNNVTKKTTDAAFTNALTKTTDGTVTFKSSNTGVATVRPSRTH